MSPSKEAVIKVISNTIQQILDSNPTLELDEVRCHYGYKNQDVLTTTVKRQKKAKVLDATAPRVR
jgi:hypothetical protein